MDDPLVPKRLEDAISIVGTCMDMCPRFERYRRERENNLFEWETVRSLSAYPYSIQLIPDTDTRHETGEPSTRSEDVRACSGGQDTAV
jgi:hypothetical protein